MGRKEQLERALIAAGYEVESNIYGLNVRNSAGQYAVEIEIGGSQFMVYNLANDSQTMCSSIASVVSTVREYIGRK